MIKNNLAKLKFSLDLFDKVDISQYNRNCAFCVLNLFRGCKDMYSIKFKLKTIADCRDKDEVLSRLRSFGMETSEEEIDELKEFFYNNNNANKKPDCCLNIQQLDRVAGGMRSAVKKEKRKEEEDNDNYFAYPGAAEFDPENPNLDGFVADASTARKSSSPSFFPARSSEPRPEPMVSDPDSSLKGDFESSRLPTPGSSTEMKDFSMDKVNPAFVKDVYDLFAGKPGLSCDDLIKQGENPESFLSRDKRIEQGEKPESILSRDKRIEQGEKPESILSRDKRIDQGEKPESILSRDKRIEQGEKPESILSKDKRIEQGENPESFLSCDKRIEQGEKPESFLSKDGLREPAKFIYSTLCECLKCYKNINEQNVDKFKYIQNGLEYCNALSEQDIDVTPMFHYFVESAEEEVNSLREQVRADLIGTDEMREFLSDLFELSENSERLSAMIRNTLEPLSSLESVPNKQSAIEQVDREFLRDVFDFFDGNTKSSYVELKNRYIKLVYQHGLDENVSFVYRALHGCLFHFEKIFSMKEQDVNKFKHIRMGLYLCNALTEQNIDVTPIRSYFVECAMKAIGSFLEQVLNGSKTTADIREMREFLLALLELSKNNEGLSAMIRDTLELLPSLEVEDTYQSVPKKQSAIEQVDREFLRDVYNFFDGKSNSNYNELERRCLTLVRQPGIGKNVESIYKAFHGCLVHSEKLFSDEKQDVDKFNCICIGIHLCNTLAKQNMDVTPIRRYFDGFAMVTVKSIVEQVKNGSKTPAEITKMRAFLSDLPEWSENNKELSEMIRDTLELLSSLEVEDTYQPVPEERQVDAREIQDLINAIKGDNDKGSDSQWEELFEAVFNSNPAQKDNIRNALIQLNQNFVEIEYFDRLDYIDNMLDMLEQK